MTNPARRVVNINHYRKNHHKRRSAGNYRWILVLLFLIICICAGYFFSLSPLFSISEMVIKGNDTVTSDHIEELSGIKCGANIFSVNEDRIKMWLSIDPTIKSAQVIRHLPSTIEITIEERPAIAILPTGQGFLYLSADGIVLLRQSKVSSLPLPLIVGAKDLFSDLVPGSKITDDNVKAGLVIVEQMAQDSLDMVAEINVEDTQKIKFFTMSDIEIRVGDSTNFGEKYKVFLEIYREQEKGNKLGGVQYIDVSVFDKPVIYYGNNAKI